MSIDLFGAIVGKTVRRRLEKEVAQGAGPIITALRPVLTDLVQAEVTAQINKAGNWVGTETGTGNLAGLLDPAITAAAGTL